jgi:choline monooxygenase
VIYPNTTIDLYPDQVTTWQIVPTGVATSRDVWGCFRPPGTGPVTRLTQRLNHIVNTDVLKEDVDLVDAVQSGIRTQGWRPGPLSAREAGVGWFADRIRRDLDGSEG